MEEKILKLRSEGKSYREIQKELKCSRSLISYYVNPTGKTSSLNRNNKNRFKKRIAYKNMFGGKCSICGYNKCYDALQFHHTDPSQKEFIISDLIFRKASTVSTTDIIKELNKCILVCANCHFELHAKSRSFVK